MKKTVLLLAALLGFSTVYAGSKYNSSLISENLSVNKTYPLNLNSYGINYLAYTSVASSVTFSAKTFTDGSVSTGTLVVTSTAGLSAVQATDSLSILSTQPVSTAAKITVNGIPLYVNVHWWFDLTSTTNTAISLKQGINQYVSGVVASTAAGPTVNLKSAQYGSYGNNMSLVSNTSTITVTSANFTGGKDTATLTINGIPVIFTPVATASGTARAIATAINANTSLNTLIVATNPATATTVWTTSTFVGAGTNYVVASSTDSSLTVGGSTKTVTGLGGASIGQMWGGLDSSYTINTSTIAIASHGFNVGLPVLYTTGTVAIGGLTNATTYYVIPVTPNSIMLSATSTGAVAGVPIVLTSSGTTTPGHTFTLTPLAISGNPSYRFEVSNDGLTYYPYSPTAGNVSVATVTYTSFVATGTVTMQDFGLIDWAWWRVNVVAPTAGAFRLILIPNGKD